MVKNLKFCLKCNHHLIEHNGGPEGMCTYPKCRCMGWIKQDFLKKEIFKISIHDLQFLVLGEIYCQFKDNELIIKAFEERLKSCDPDEEMGLKRCIEIIKKWKIEEKEFPSGNIIRKSYANLESLISIEIVEIYKCLLSD